PRGSRRELALRHRLGRPNSYLAKVTVLLDSLGCVDFVDLCVRLLSTAMGSAKFKDLYVHRISVLTQKAFGVDVFTTMITTSDMTSPASVSTRTLTPQSGNNMQLEITLPHERPLPATQSFEKSLPSGLA